MSKMRTICIWLIFICLMSIQILYMPVTKAVSDVEVKYETIKNWKHGFLGKITIQNNRSVEIDQWKLEFDWDKEIIRIWDAKIEEHNNNHYVISFDPCKKTIPPGKKVSFRFMANNRNITSVPSNFVLKDIYDQLDVLDSQWQQYDGMRIGEEFQKSYAHGVAYLWARFPNDRPHRIGYEIIERNPVKEYIQAKYQNVTFQTEDGHNLKGLFFPVKKPKGTIIMLHGYGSTAIWETAKLEFLLSSGYQIFSYNARHWNYYKTPEKHIQLMSNEVKDVGSAINYLKTRRDVDKDKIVIYGFSYGAFKAELFAPFSNDVKAVIFDGGGASIPTFSPDIAWEMIADDVIKITNEVYGDNPDSFSVSFIPSPYLNSMKQMNKPSLFIHGANDPTPVSEAESIYNVTAGPKELHIFPNSGHCDAMYTEDRDHYIKTVLNFLKKYL